MKIKLNYIYIIIIAFLISLLIFGYNLNKKSSLSKKNEILNIVQQLKTRNSQIAEIQKNLFKNDKNINDLINKKEINFKKVDDDKQLTDFDKYSFSKYMTNDILFNGNRGAIGTGYIDFYNEDKKLILATYDGIFAYSEINNLENFKKINSNINSLIKYEKFYLHEQYGIKDIFVDIDTLYVAYIGNKKDNCYDLKIISSKLNEEYLNFQPFYQTSNCVDKNNNHGFWAHQGAGGRITKIDNFNLLFTTGDFRNRPLAQNTESDFGKILKINLQNKKAKVISMGHRNPQGLYYSKSFNFILSTEHGPKGGDEININHKPFLDIKNFGWPISSYGKHYYKHYSKEILSDAPLNNSHKKYGFEEPIKYFDPSIGISEVIPFNQDDSEFLIGAMGNEIKDQDLGIHYIQLDKERIKIINHKFIPLNERVRDMIISKDKKTIIMFLETTSSLAVFKKNN
jgi:hypothetical protein